MSEREVLDSPETIPIAIIPQPGTERAEARPSRREEREQRERERRRGLSRATTMLPPALVALALGAYQIGTPQVREDESATWWAAHLSWSDLGRLLDNTDVVLAPYYVLMHLWVTVAGSSPVVLRLPSLLAMTATAAALALLGRRMFDGPTGLIGGLIFAVLPATTRYAQDARPYALSALAVVVGALLLYRALDHEGADRWGGYALGMLGTGLFHPVAATVVVAYLLIVFATDRQRAGAWFSVTVVPVAPLLAVLMLARGQNHQHPKGGTGLDALRHLPQDLLGSVHVALAVGVLAVLGVLLGRRNGVALLVWAVLPPVAVFALRSYGNLFTPSYFVFTLPAIALLAAAGVCGLGRALPGRATSIVPRQLVAGLVAFAAVAAVSVTVLPSLRDDPQPGAYDFHAAARFVALQQKPGDGIVYSGQLDVATRAMAYQLRDAPQPLADVYAMVSPQRGGTYTGKPCAAPVVCTKGVDRIWLVSTAPAATPYAGMTADEGTFLRTEYKASPAREFDGGLRVVLFQRAAKAGGRG
ncbi:glycosyltransferase family 39 protein [Actinacidiphila paucisporea]|uniref:Mannosyltransferase n=1 Tax=Actinacidiphila paucisporea TaxID=310782 RepID=A0A1M7QF29_9ACTN|nr:glycosyltransferase family 39 protein [Actinacidiphila paucisporea]SHN29171.1 mannosyltransferase [Actinacidiphila paucisporea]